MSSSLEEFKISVQGLQVGMYVARLDRPWLNAPFPLQGLMIASSDDIRKIQQLCSSVYVDVTRGESPELRFIQLDGPAVPKPDRSREEVGALHTTTWEVTSNLRAEMVHAKRAHETLKDGIAEVMRDLQGGGNLQIDKLRDGVEAMIDSITRNPSAFNWLREIKRKDDYAYHHALACSVWAASFGRHLGLNRSELTVLTLAGLLFDVGKLRIPPGILAKSASFDDHDHQTMRSHVQHGIDILGSVPGVSPRLIDAVATHHERHDGSGYPNGLIGGAIPIYGRIIGLIDSYDVMTSIRTHRHSRSPHQVVMELYESRDRLFQAELVELFIQTSGIYPIGSLVELTNGAVGVVTAVHSLKRLRPTVMLLLDEHKAPLPEFESVDLGVQDINGQAVLGIRAGLPQGSYGIDPAELFLD